MNTLTQTPPPAREAPASAPPKPAPPPPGPKLWTREEFYRLAEQGYFDGQRVERLGGELVVMSPQDWVHSCAVDAAFEALLAVFGRGHWVRCQLPFEFSLSSDPEPDVSVVVGRRQDYTAHPQAAVLIVEVANSSLDLDRGRKASLYASAGVPDYWVVDVVGRRAEVCRDPQPDATQRHGWGYADRRWLSSTDTVSPLAAPAATISVAALLG